MVVNAIAAGRRGAIAIDKYLRGDDTRVEIYDRKAPLAEQARPPELEDTWESMPRTAVRTLPVPDRRTTFTEIELGFTEEIARKEAKRCLRCDLEG
jgi:NADH-quinone oxidoreductase subunit F